MSWIKNSLVIFFVSIATIVTIDAVGYIFKDKINIFFPNYGRGIEDFSRGYPIGHFKNDSEIGFDITPNFEVEASTKSSEFLTYDVWGNSYGCFDDEWSEDSIVDGIYLAGDSFTWGYAKYEKKFGTLLEERLGRKVYACGVTHTGQGHQFKKFKRLFDNGLKPSLVIVNVVTNDSDNDFFFPHTAIVNGFMVENIESCGDFTDPNFRYNKLAYEDVVKFVSEKQNEVSSIKSLLRQFSLTANVTNELTRSIGYKMNSLVQEENKIIQKTSCNKISVYQNLSGIDSLYPVSKFTEKNREFISNWIVHSELNDYKLIFSFIPEKDITSNSSIKFIKQYILEKGGSAYSFDDYCDATCRSESEVYYQDDGHFNESGNELYAQYLLKLIESQSRRRVKF
jgi:lysophospholipase L1-like esterase